tara:strand:+ start:19283 stop:19552 length:270 start_codon:yes stop_codon:yes gene_type:complete
MSDKFTHNQLRWALNTIAHKAALVQTLCGEAIQSTDDEQGEGGAGVDLIAAARSIVEQIGWIADHHSQAGERGDATQWMLPPFYHWDPE